MPLKNSVSVSQSYTIRSYVWGPEARFDIHGGMGKGEFERGLQRQAKYFPYMYRQKEVERERERGQEEEGILSNPGRGEKN